MDPSTIVLLENLPPSFSEATLKSIIGHVPCKGRVVSHQLIPDLDNVAAHVHFERAEDAEAAVRLWDHLTIDNATITATCEADAKKRLHKSVTQQHSTGLRYPFAPMSVGWLHEFVSSLKNPERSFAMCRVLEVLMTNAVMTSDCYMEHAVVTFYTKFQSNAWTKAQSLVSEGVTFELCRQVFEVIGLIRRYSSANLKSRRMLLTLVDRVVDDISKVTTGTKTLTVNKAIPEIVASIRTHIAKLRGPATQAQVTAGGAAAATGGGAAGTVAATSTAPMPTQQDVDEALHALTSWLKFLFACLSSHHNQVPTFPETSAIAPCSEQCQCFSRIRAKYPVYLADVEKVKIIDSLVIHAVRDGEDDVANIARELLHRYSVDFCARAVTHIHNGVYAILRLHLFNAVYLAKKAHGLTMTQCAKSYSAIELVLAMLWEAIGGNTALKQVAPLIASALSCLAQLRAKPEELRPAMQEMYTLQFDMCQLFNAICGQQFLLCVHVGEGVVQPGRVISIASAAGGDAGTAKPRCANQACTSSTNELLKCSACKATYYCSPACQKADWRRHKTECKDMSVQRIPSSPPAVAAAPLPTADESASTAAASSSSAASSAVGTSSDATPISGAGVSGAGVAAVAAMPKISICIRPNLGMALRSRNLYDPPPTVTIFDAL